METIVARYNTSEAAAASAVARTAEAAGSATFTAERDSATDTHVVIRHEARPVHVNAFCEAFRVLVDTTTEASGLAATCPVCAPWTVAR